MLCGEAKVALVAFTAYAFVTIYLFNSADVNIIVDGSSKQKDWIYFAISLLFGSLLTFFMPHPEVARRGGFIGIVFGAGSIIGLLASAKTGMLFGFYLVILAVFHFSEYMLTAVYKQESLSVDSFLLNHSLEYHLAIAASLLEFIIEAWLLSYCKDAFVSQCFSIIGIALVIFGEVCRKLAMITAKSNFSHNVQYKKKEGHCLVTTGIYSLSRHPAYVGWFYWSIGTQLWLCNPICSIGYAIASWKFFYERLREEEFYLLKFFGEEYLDYMGKVPTRLPFNSGLESEVKTLYAVS